MDATCKFSLQGQLRIALPAVANKQSKKVKRQKISSHMLEKNESVYVS